MRKDSSLRMFFILMYNPDCAVHSKVLIPLNAGGCPVPNCFIAILAIVTVWKLQAPFHMLFGQNTSYERTHQDWHFIFICKFILT